MTRAINDDVNICLNKIREAIGEVIEKHNHLVVPVMTPILGMGSTLPIDFTVHTSEVLLMAKRK